LGGAEDPTAEVAVVLVGPKAEVAATEKVWDGSATMEAPPV
jgi:hypothetical protein